MSLLATRHSPLATRFFRAMLLGGTLAGIWILSSGCERKPDMAVVELAPVTTPSGMVVSVSSPASDVGAVILGRGGNAVDAAVATAFALAVTYPPAGNIGGGGYMLVYPTGGEPTAFDFRETAPSLVDREMFVHPEDRTPHRRVGIPGTVAGLAHRS